MIWPILRLVWDSRGHKLEGISADLTGEFGEGFSSANLTRLTTKTKEEAPEKVSAFILSLPVLPGAEEKAEVVRLGIAAMEGGPAVDAAALAAELVFRMSQTVPEVLAAALVVKFQANPEAIVKALLSQFPTDEFALALANALARQARLSSETGSLLDVFAQAIAGRLPRAPKLARLLARRLARRLDRLSAKHLILAGAAGGAVACGVTLLLLALSGRHAPEAVRAPEVANITPPQPLVIVANATPGGAPFIFELNALLGALAERMGEKPPPELYIPDGPLPYQKVPPCDSGYREQAIRGGCWAKIATQPPCGKLFRSGDGCYRPIAADPSKPVGLTPEKPCQEHGPGQERPTRERRDSDPAKEP